MKAPEAVEKQRAELTAAESRQKDWRRVVGISEDNEFTRATRAEIEAAREAERETARRGDADEPDVIEPQHAATWGEIGDALIKFVAQRSRAVLTVGERVEIGAARLDPRRRSRGRAGSGS